MKHLKSNQWMSAATWFLLAITAAVSMQLPSSLPTVQAALPAQGEFPIIHVTTVRTTNPAVRRYQLRAIEFADGHTAAEFIRPTGLIDLRFTGRADWLRVRDHRDHPPRMHSLADAGLDLVGFRTRMLQSLRSEDLADTIDLVEGGDYSLVLAFERPILDDDPRPDHRGELLILERGRGAGDSWLLLQAVDRQGRALGPPYLLNPRELDPTSPPTHVKVGRRTQELGGMLLDLTALGVTQVQFLRISAPVRGEEGFTGGDRGADFKVLGVDT